jgi:hypothetical protein
MADSDIIVSLHLVISFHFYGSSITVVNSFIGQTPGRTKTFLLDRPLAEQTARNGLSAKLK